MNEGRPVIDGERCKACGLCIANCPKKILSRGEDFNSQGAFYTVCVDETQCIACGVCAMMCPDAAIEINKIVKEKINV